MKKIIILISLVLSLCAEDIVVYTNEYKILKLDKKVKRLIVGNKEMVNVSLLKTSQTKGTLLKIFGKVSGNTSILIMYRDGSMNNYHIYVNENLGFVQKMINVIEPKLVLSKVGNGSTVISGEFQDPHDKKRIYKLLQNAGVDMSKLMDLTETKEINKMIRTKLYLVEINNRQAEDLGGITGLGFFSQYIDVSINPSAANGATFSGWLLDNFGNFSASKGKSVSATLNFLQESGIGTILDDTVLMTTEDENASFRVGGEVYIPVGVSQNLGLSPTILLEEKEYGLALLLSTQFMEKDGYMHISVNIKDSQFDTNKDHDVQLGENIFVPSFVSKTMLTNVVVKSGQVIALGGRLHTENVTKEEKVPFLGDIPLLGELFKHSVTSDQTNDLLFFLVPEIVDANAKIDDTHYYKSFKEDAKEFHIQLQDMNATQATHTQEIQETQELLLSNPLEDTELMVIEIEGEELVINEATESVIIELPQEVKSEEIKESKLKLYQVTVGKVFLRSVPVTGTRSLVWKEGHKFTVKEEKVQNGVTWLRIKEDCFNTCKAIDNILWISNRYTSVIEEKLIL
ncbi:General secretion pathway protein D [hydrothermal vent metagenome]|uniref:General secretion pathway protein D n=1 Tax=hydrothermal vent metagenome TaxID=652676 RepID=A0A1W1CLF9_9ZZZZ